MRANRKKRLYWILSMMAAASMAVGLIIYALGQNINLYFTPSQLAKEGQVQDVTIRVGGMVQENSVKHEDKGLIVHFVVTDFTHTVPVVYEGVLPALFREGQGIVVQGVLKDGVLQANEVLAKHDENYMPPM